jgi:hemerythrin
MEWSQRFSVGVDRIDQQHQELFRRLDALIDALSEDDLTHVRSTLEFLEQYVREHFTAEEAEMDATHYPGAAAHKREHERYLELLLSLRREFQKSGATPWLATRLQGALIDWLKRHILSVDQELGRYLIAQKTRAAGNGH